VRAVEDVLDNYAHHARAARDLAEEHFSSEKVLSSPVASDRRHSMSNRVEPATTRSARRI